MSKRVRDIGPYFVVVRGLRTGIFDTYREIQHMGADRVASGWIYKKFDNRSDAIAWHQRGTTLPPLNNPNAVSIFVGNVTCDRDYAAVCIHFWEKDRRNICLQANTSSKNLDLKIVIHALTIAPKDRPLCIYTNSQKVAYGWNYSLCAWPKRSLGIAEPVLLWQKLEKLIRSRDHVVAIDWRKDDNPAHLLALQCCQKQWNKQIPSFRSRIIMEQRQAWLFCAICLGLVKDIRLKIALLISDYWQNMFNIDY